MPDDAPESEENIISLQSISRTFMAALQRQHDMLAFSLAGLRTSDPRAYDYYSAVSRVMPSPQNHLTADQVNAYARNLMMRTTINDLLGIAAECLHRCHLLCVLIKVRGQNRAPDADLDRQIGESHQAFLQLSLQDKFEELEKSFGIMCDLEDSIFSLAAALRVLARVGGMVTNDDLAPDEGRHVEVAVVVRGGAGEVEQRLRVRRGLAALAARRRSRRPSPPLCRLLRLAGQRRAHARKHADGAL